MSTFLLYFTPDDESFLSYLKPICQGHRIVLKSTPVQSASELEIAVRSHKADAVMTCSEVTLGALAKPIFGENSRKRPTLNDFFGSIIKVPRKIEVDKPPMEVLVLNPLKQFVTVNYGKFLFARFISKLTMPTHWYRPSQFIWSMIDQENVEEVYNKLHSAEMIAVDVETDREVRGITMVSYTGLWWLDGRPHTESYVLPVDSMWAVSWMRKFNLLEPPKVLQNGKYDCALFFRFGAPLNNYLWDTINAAHCWYSELPKRLDFIAAFFLRDVEFWKDEGKSGQKTDQYRYNARDGWATLNALLAWFREVPDWALENYRQEFPLVFPCHMSEMQGIFADLERMAAARAEQEQKIAKLQRSLETMLGTPGFNPASPKQVLKLLHILGNNDLKSSDEISIKKAMFRHPIAGRILQTVLDIRKARKLVSTYLVEEKVWHGKIFYNLNPHGTDTARLASAESHYECGVQIQNVPRGKLVKSVYMADPGFLFGEGDYEQAEARDTAYLSGDEKLIATVESPLDYHALNCERFFGLPYDSIVNPNTGETINSEIRDLGKRVNHGANYNMGPGVLIDTMGLHNIFKAARLLKLPIFWSAWQIAEYLLDRYDYAYPIVRSTYYDSIKYRISTTRLLVSPFGWTRYCFGNPEKSKSDLNAYAAHPSQNLNAGTLNRAYMRVFKEVALPNIDNYRLNAQIHDSILFQYRIGHEDLIQKTVDCMLMDTPVTDPKGTTRILRVPVGMKAGGRYWSEIKKWTSAKT